MEIIRKVYCEDEYLGKFKLQKIKDEYVWTYILDFSKQVRSAEIFYISKKRFDDIDGFECINSTYIDGKSKKTKLIFNIKFEEGDI